MATSIEIVRAWIRDSDPANYLFSDPQLQIYIDAALNNPLLAAAFALYALAADKAKIGSLREVYQIRLDTTQMSRSLMAVADSLRKIAYSTPAAFITTLTVPLQDDLTEEAVRRRMLTFDFDVLADIDDVSYGQGYGRI